jgi:hypothetical protein
VPEAAVHEQSPPMRPVRQIWSSWEFFGTHSEPKSLIPKIAPNEHLGRGVTLANSFHARAYVSSWLHHRHHPMIVEHHGQHWEGVVGASDLARAMHVANAAQMTASPTVDVVGTVTEE